MDWHVEQGKEGLTPDDTDFDNSPFLGGPVEADDQCSFRDSLQLSARLPASSSSNSFGARTRRDHQNYRLEEIKLAREVRRRERVSASLHEVERYSGENTLTGETYPLQWWRQRSRDFPRMAMLARKVFSIDAAHQLTATSSRKQLFWADFGEYRQQIGRDQLSVCLHFSLNRQHLSKRWERKSTVVQPLRGEDCRKAAHAVNDVLGPIAGYVHMPSQRT